MEEYADDEEDVLEEGQGQDVLAESDPEGQTGDLEPDAELLDSAVPQVDDETLAATDAGPQGGAADEEQVDEPEAGTGKAKGKGKGKAKGRKGSAAPDPAALSDAADQKLKAATLLFQERFQREQAMAMKNAAKVHSKWRDLLRQAKKVELQKQVQHVAEAHEHAMQSRGKLMEWLIADVAEAQRMHKHAVDEHLSVVSGLLELQDDRLGRILADFEASVQDLATKYNTGHQAESEIQAGHQKALSTIHAAMEAEFAQMQATALTEAQGRLRNARNHTAEDYNMLKLTMEARRTDLLHILSSEHKGYTKATQARSQEVANLQLRDTTLQASTESRRAAIARSHEAISSTRVSVERTQREWRADSAAMQDEISGLAPHFAALKAQRTQARRSHDRNMRQLSVSIAKTEELLHQKLDKAQSILGLAQLCRKFEMDYEHVSSRQALSETAALPGNVEEADTVAPGLAHFQTCYSQVLLDKSEMDLEIGQLRADIKNIEATLSSMVTGHFAGGYRAGQQGDNLCVIRSMSRLTL